MKQSMSEFRISVLQLNLDSIMVFFVIFFCRQAKMSDVDVLFTST